MAELVVARTRHTDPMLGTLRNYTTGLYLITAICGLLDAVCFLALGGVFAEIMTGNLLLMAFTFGAGDPVEDTTKFMLPLAAFTLGALGGGRLLRGSAQVRERRLGFAFEWLLIVATVVISALASPDDRNGVGLLVVALLAFAMGIQNAMVRVHGIPDLATNVMTLTLTAVIADSRPAGGDSRNWRRRALSISLFVVSAAVGAYLLRFDVLWPLLLAAVIFSVALVPLIGGTRPESVGRSGPDAIFPADGGGAPGNQ